MPAGRPRRADVRGAPCRETRLVTLMDKDASVQRVVLEHRPSTTADAIAFVGPVEGELDGRLAVALADPIIETGFDGDELISPRPSGLSVRRAGPSRSRSSAVHNSIPVIRQRPTNGRRADASARVITSTCWRREVMLDITFFIVTVRCSTVFFFSW